MSPIKFPTKLIFPNFHILNINRMMSFCNLFMQRPSYYHTVVLCFIVFNFKKCHGRQSSFCCPSVFKMTYDVSNGMLSPIVSYQLRTCWVHFRLNSLAFVQKPTSFLILTQQLWFLVFQVD